MTPSPVLDGASRVVSSVIDENLRRAATRLLGDELGWRRSAGEQLVAEVSAALGHPDDSVSYLLLACLRAEIPSEIDVVEFTRSWRVDGLRAPLLAAHRSASLGRARLGARPVVVESGIVVDVTDTGRSRFTTGIQRVARSMLDRWARDHELSLVSWTTRGTRMLDTTPAEVERVIATLASRGRIRDHEGAVVVPFESTFVLPEITTEARRTASLRTVARFSRSRSLAIGFDCIPVTTSETSGLGMPGAFSKYLATLTAFDTIAAISEASAVEYGGWRRMLGGAGLVGPRVETVPLPWQAESMSDETVARVAEKYDLDDGRPVVLAVGSHEPRKNHLNLLTAAELNWRQGSDFHLVMVGGNAWDDHDFRHTVAALQRKGRPLTLLSGVDDDVIWSLYRLARFSVFCSINEGFGLPVAESLANGTPVLTSDFGSMSDLGAGNGALTVDPRDIRAMAEAMGHLLGDDALIAELHALTQSLEHPDWDDYADVVWRLATA